MNYQLDLHNHLDYCRVLGQSVAKLQAFLDIILISGSNHDHDGEGDEEGVGEDDSGDDEVNHDLVGILHYTHFRYGGSLPNVNQMSAGGCPDVQNNVQGNNIYQILVRFPNPTFSQPSPFPSHYPTFFPSDQCCDVVSNQQDVSISICFPLIFDMRDWKYQFPPPGNKQFQILCLKLSNKSLAVGEGWHCMLI